LRFAAVAQAPDVPIKSTARRSRCSVSAAAHFRRPVDHRTVIARRTCRTGLAPRRTFVTTTIALTRGVDRPDALADRAHRNEVHAALTHVVACHDFVIPAIASRLSTDTSSD